MTAPSPDDWRGTAPEEVQEMTPSLSGFLRSRSRVLLGELLRPHRRSMHRAIVAVLVFMGSTLAGPFLIKLAIDTGIPPLERGDGSGRLLAIVAVFLAVSVVGAAADYLYTRMTGRIGQDILFDLRTRLFDHFQRLSLGFHEKYTSGRVISRLTSDVDAIAEFLSFGLQSLVWGVLMVAGISIVMLVIDFQLALIALVTFPVVIAATLWFRANSEKAYRASREAVALVIVHFVESLGGIRAVQAFRREPRNQAIFEDVNGRYRAANIWSSKLNAVYGPGVRTLGYVSSALVLGFGGIRYLNNQTTLGDLAALVLYLRRLFDPVQELSQFYTIFQSAAAALEKLSGVFDEQPSVPEPTDPVVLAEARGQLTFAAVNFRYRPDTPIVLHDLDLEIPAGQTVALVGATGAGKTTVARLIARFYDPSQGAVRLDGVDLRDLSVDDLRRAVVMVTQESYLFTGSVADNIAFGRPDASRADIEAAARAIGAHTFIERLPEGYDTDVHKRGGRLSAGQKQLVAFARAFLADPKVLILDEATSSLDIPSERLVQRALRTLLADRTAIIIAHRLTTVEIADRVLVVDAGRVVEDGTPDDLIAGTGRYHDLHEAWLESLA